MCPDSSASPPCSSSPRESCHHLHLLETKEPQPHQTGRWSNSDRDRSTKTLWNPSLSHQLKFQQLAEPGALLECLITSNACSPYPLFIFSPTLSSWGNEFHNLITFLGEEISPFPLLNDLLSSLGSGWSLPQEGEGVISSVHPLQPNYDLAALCHFFLK